MILKKLIPIRKETATLKKYSECVVANVVIVVVGFSGYVLFKRLVFL